MFKFFVYLYQRERATQNHCKQHTCYEFVFFSRCLLQLYYLCAFLYQIDSSTVVYGLGLHQL